MTQDTICDFGGRLRRARRRANVKLVNLARRAGISASHLANLEAGQGAPSWRLAVLLATLLRVPLCELGGPRHQGELGQY